MGTSVSHGMLRKVMDVISMTKSGLRGRDEGQRQPTRWRPATCTSLDSGAHGNALWTSVFHFCGCRVVPVKHSGSSLSASSGYFSCSAPAGKGFRTLFEKEMNRLLKYEDAPLLNHCIIMGAHVDTNVTSNYGKGTGRHISGRALSA
eukprot:6182959-Pleurochrysis_carterae.AAC.2